MENDVLLSKKVEFTFILLIIFSFFILFYFFETLDKDDIYYTSAIISTQDNPELSLFGFDMVHGEKHIVTAQSDLHRIQSYELIIAFLGNITGIPALTWYFYIFPAIFIIFCVFVYWSLFSFFAHDRIHLLMLLLVCLLILLFWREGRGYGRFFIVKFYHGKGVFATVIVPLLLYYNYKFLESDNKYYVILVFFTLVSSIVLASTAAVVGPIFLVILILCNFIVARDYKSLLYFSIPIFYSLSLLLVTKYQIDTSDSLSNQYVNIRPMWLVFGAENYRYLASSFLFMLILFIKSKKHNLIDRHAMLLFLTTYFIILNPFLYTFIGKEIHSGLSWRILWCVPVPFFITLSIDWITTAISRNKITKYILTCVILVFFGLLGQFTTANLPFKIQKFNYRIPEETKQIIIKINKLTTVDTLVLAPLHISRYIPSFHNRPKLVGARVHYIHSLKPPLGETNVDSRLYLFQLFSSKKNFQVDERLRISLNTLGVDFVVLHHAHYQYEQIKEVLESIYSTRLDYGEVSFWW